MWHAAITTTLVLLSWGLWTQHMHALYTERAASATLTYTLCTELARSRSHRRFYSTLCASTNEDAPSWYLYAGAALAPLLLLGLLLLLLRPTPPPPPLFQFCMAPTKRATKLRDLETGLRLRNHCGDRLLCDADS